MTLELPREPRSPARARAALGGFRTNLPHAKYEAAELLVSELVSNAVKYGGEGPLQLVVSSQPGRLRAEVIDRGGGFQSEPRDADDVHTPGGWGLHLVERLADDWGSYEGSTHVWFEMHASD
jgi:anti-sigma regulatory factor (Ser/Thr protein kinase)